MKIPLKNQNNDRSKTTIYGKSKKLKNIDDKIMIDSMPLNPEFFAERLKLNDDFYVQDYN